MRHRLSRQLDRAIMRERLSWIGGVVALIAIVAAGLWLTDLDASVDVRHVTGVVESVQPLGGQKPAIEAERIAVLLADGRHVTVVAPKMRALHTGDAVAVAEHHHHTGRTTFTLETR